MLLNLLCITILISVVSVTAYAEYDPFFGYCWCPGHLSGTEYFTPGDVNHDGKMDAKDAVLVLRISVSKPVYTMSQYTGGKNCPSFWVMDVNGDGAIQAKDALEILKYSVMKIDGFARQPVLYTPVTNTDVTNTNQSN